MNRILFSEYIRLYQFFFKEIENKAYFEKNWYNESGNWTHLRVSDQWRIQDFPQGGAPTPKIAIIFQIFAENCMKMKEFGPPGGGARPWRPP